MKDYWNISLFLSFLLHIFIFFGLENIKLFKKESLKVYKLSDIKILEQRITKPTEEIYKLREKFIEESPPPYLDNFFEKITSSFKIEPPQKMNIVEIVDKEIIFKEILSSEFKKDPKYMEYYQKVRAKISNVLHRNYKGQDTGEIILSFVLLRDGNIKEVYFKEDSPTKEVLKDIVLRSLYDAEPFPPFPEDFKDRYSLPFSVNIQFKR